MTIAASNAKPILGGCQCGAVRYEITEDPVALYVCHCTECRKQSASAFGISLIVRRADFRLTKGSPKRWSRSTDSGRTLHCNFCPDCGSRIVHEGGPEREVISVKGGSVDQPLDLSEAVHIWTTRKLPGVLIPEHASRFDEEPDD
jgi:hypothetical protein